MAVAVPRQEVRHSAVHYDGGMSQQRPQYGEYATPEQQRIAAGLPPVETVQLEQPEPDARREAASAASDSEPAPVPRRGDRIATIALLAYGLINVLFTAGSYLDLPSVLERTLELLGIEGTFTNYAQGRLWGGIAAIVLVLGWLITAVVAVRRLRTGRLTWWVPLVGAAVTFFVTSLCVMVPMLSDPAFMAALTP